jgi:phage portal protein BeeE
MTYSNVESERRDLVDLSLRPYVSSLEGRLSLDDVIPHGQTVSLDLDDFYRGDMAARSAYYTAGLAGGWLVVDEVRSDEDRPPLGGAPL